MQRTFTLFVVLCLGHVLLISSQVQSKEGGPVLESVAFRTVSQVQGVAAGAADGTKSVWRRYFALRGVERENETLRQRVLELEGRLQAEEARARRTTELEALLKMQQEHDLPTLAAKVIAGSPAPGTLTVTIDRGSAHGVAKDMAVLAGGGVVGRVISTAPHASQVQLLIGRSAAAGAILEKSGTGAIAVGGAGDGLLSLEMVQGVVTVDLGEAVLTSGQDKIFPHGFAIGVVERVDGAGKNRKIWVKPAVDFSHIEVVLVVLSPPGLAPGVE